MGIARRKLLQQSLMGGFFAVAALVFPSQARACLYGKWWVVCPNNHVDEVDDGTCQHKCSKCGQQCFRGNTVTVLCPKGHRNDVTSQCDHAHCTQHFNCTTCGVDCRHG